MTIAAELRELACELATLGGSMAADGWRRDIASGTTRTTMTAATKSSRTDVVTLHDRAAEATIVAALTARRPDDAIVGEEGTEREGTSGVSWFLDPIDGTVNFLYGFPLWSTSVGVADNDGAVAGAVFVPVTGELFAAARGEGATRNGEPIRASGEVDLSLALVATGFGYLPSRRSEQADTAGDADPSRPRHPSRRLCGARSLLHGSGDGRRLLRGRVEQLGHRRR